MTKEYEIEVHVTHRVWVEADSLAEAEEIAMDQFSDDAGLWDDFDMVVISEEEI